MTLKPLTKEILKEWGADTDVYKRFCELLPKGATLEEAINTLVEDGHDEWGYWLFDECRNDDRFRSLTLNGYRNIGSSNSGCMNVGCGNTGDWNTGNWNPGDGNTGNGNTGDWNPGNGNTGDWNTGNENTGYWNPGNWNPGDGNTGDGNTGDWNTGNWNPGDGNTGHWNSGNWNVGNFNSKTPDEILMFNKPCKREVWDSCQKPLFIYFRTNVWIYESDMSDKEKADNPHFNTTGGYLKTVPYKEAWKNAYDNATKEDIALLKALPNFDADVFEEITGIRVEEDEN